MDLLMCLDCGEFVPATRTDGTYEPVSATTCPDCGGTSFKHNDSETVVETD